MNEEEKYVSVIKEVSASWYSLFLMEVIRGYLSAENGKIPIEICMVVRKWNKILTLRYV